MATNFQWICPFCNHHQIVTGNNYHGEFRFLDVGKSERGFVGIVFYATRCLNEKCNEVELKVVLKEAEHRDGGWRAGDEIDQWNLRPESSSKFQPDYIPTALREDYYEACVIRDKSPKAAATLARRCLQGMIRDFCGISKARLIDEVRELKRLVDEGTAPKGVEPETIDAIDAVRDIGNIGAHMERDISLIIDVDPGEVQALIELIEMLFEDWYVARQKRADRLATVLALAAEKKEAIRAARSGPVA
jgi:hypothetical protein